MNTPRESLLMIRMSLTVLFALTVLLYSSAASAQEAPDYEGDGFELSLKAELGFVSPLYHRIQFGQDGTYIDYVDEGGQDVLFEFQRYSVEALLGERHRLVLLWQPLDIETRVRLQRDLLVDEATFEEGTPVDMLYRFPFYRLSYLYDLIDSERTELSLGGSLQIRNATIAVTTVDGELRRERRDVGLVPILKVRARHQLESRWWFGAEVDGFYAPIRYLNLSDTDVLGAILDASLRGGRQVSENVDVFLNARYLGGGADGTSPRQAEEGPGDGYTRNWLNLLSVSLGLEYHFR
jgi:hypothetical protein